MQLTRLFGHGPHILPRALQAGLGLHGRRVDARARQRRQQLGQLVPGPRVRANAVQHVLRIVDNRSVTGPAAGCGLCPVAGPQLVRRHPRPALMPSAACSSSCLACAGGKLMPCAPLTPTVQ